jgi:hypothetical protein
VTLIVGCGVVLRVAPGSKDKTRCTPYVSLGSQMSHITTNKGNIKVQCLIYNVPTNKITLGTNSR